MPASDRTAESSANVTRRSAQNSHHQRVLSNLQAVYQKIIHTSGAAFPFRAKESSKYVYPSARQPSRRSNGRYEPRRLYTADSAMYNPRIQSAAQSIEEIVITPLKTAALASHDHQSVSAATTVTTAAAATKNSRRHSIPVATVTATPRAVSLATTADEDSSSDITKRQDCVKSGVVQMRAKSSVNLSGTDYSEQSIRFVAEQVAKEQARQLKMHANPRQHRVDRKYFVCGASCPRAVQAFNDRDSSGPALQQRNAANGGKNGRVVMPLERSISRGLGGGGYSPRRRILTPSTNVVVLSNGHCGGAAVVGTSADAAAAAQQTTAGRTGGAADAAGFVSPLHPVSIPQVTLLTSTEQVDKVGAAHLPDSAAASADNTGCGKVAV